MSKRDFIAFVDGLRSTLGTITDDQWKTLLQQARQNHGLTTDEATRILKDSRLVVGELVNYFEVLGLTIEKLENQGEEIVKSLVDNAHLPLYKRALQDTSHGAVERRNLLNEAKNTLLDPEKRRRHIEEIRKLTTPEPEALFKFPNGDEAISIPQLALLMAKNARDAVEALYQGNLEQSLRRFGETHFANAARAVVSQFPRNRQIGFLAISAILRGKVKFRQGNEASTPQQLARLIDQNWEQSKTLLYNGFIALWLEYTKQTQLATTAKAITNRNRSEQDIGLEELVQKLDPQLGKPKLEVSPSRIDFGSIDTESQKTIDIQITNRGRGFLHGTVQLATDMPGLQISDTEIRDEGVVFVKLDASHLTPNKTYQTTLVLNTNGGVVRAPISCDVIQKPTQVVPDVKVKNRVEEKINYFEVLGLSVDDLQGKDEGTIKSIVNGAHRKLYARTVGAYANVPRPDGRTPGQWQVILNHARDTLLDSQKRRVYITERTQQPEVTEIEEAPDVNTKDKDGNTPLYLAAMENDYGKVGALIMSGADVNAKSSYGETPLHKAALHNASKTAEVLLRSGADINAKDNDGWTPLHRTAWYDASETAEILLKNGADINAKNEKNEYGGTPLHRAARHNASKTAEVLLRSGADINGKDNDGSTPLHRAAQNDASETAEILLKNGADINAKTKYSETPLHRATESYRNASEITEILLKNGANVNAKDDNGWTPLHTAAWKSASETVEILLKNGANVNAKTNEGRTPLRVAPKKDASGTVDVLRRHGGKKGGWW